MGRYCEFGSETIDIFWHKVKRLITVFLLTEYRELGILEISIVILTNKYHTNGFIFIYYIYYLYKNKNIIFLLIRDPVQYETK